MDSAENFYLIVNTAYMIIYIYIYLFVNLTFQSYTGQAFYANRQALYANRQRFVKTTNLDFVAKEVLNGNAVIHT